jgi:hypothetical protein
VRGSDIPSPALSALVSLQGLSILDFDQTLEEVVPEDMLSEPTADDVMAVCSEILDVGSEVSRAVSHASSTLEGSLQCQDIGPSCPTPMEVTGEPSALEAAAAENPAPEGIPTLQTCLFPHDGIPTLQTCLLIFGRLYSTCP